jgi:pyridoxal phosphate-dependent aminotransferase EpsN
VGRGDEVVVSSFTFSASVNVVKYLGAEPVFVDADDQNWNMDPNLLQEELRQASSKGRKPKAVICVDLYGQCADYTRIESICAQFGVPLIEDAAEALGATHRGRPAGSFGVMAAFSFNGNKIITTSGGGMLVSRDKALMDRARFLATQARDAAPHYQHSEIGYNYRMSNVLAAIGRGQLRVLSDRVRARRANKAFYRQALAGVPGIDFAPDASDGEPNNWLTCVTIDPAAFGASREDVRLALEREDIEARPVWKPMHLQPVFAGCRVCGGEVSERIFENGLCLPSGSSLSKNDLARICDVVLSARRKATPET